MIFLSSKRFFRARSLYTFAEWLLSAWPRLELLFLYYTQLPSAKFFFPSFFCIRHASELGGYFTTFRTEMVNGLVILSGDQCYITAAFLSWIILFYLLSFMEPSALEPSTVIMNGYTVIFFSSDTSLSGRCLSFALWTFPILRCDVSFLLPYIQMRFF